MWSREALREEETTVGQLDNVLDKYQSLLVNSAITTFGTKKCTNPVDRSPKTSKPWYTDECRQQKTVFNRARKRYLKDRSNENKLYLREESKRYKRLLKSSLNKYNKRQGK